MKKSFLILSISLIFFPSKIYAAEETIHVYGQHIHRDFFFYISNSLSPNETANFFNASPGLYGVPGWVHKLKEWQSLCGNIMGAMRGIDGHCKYNAYKQASDGHAFCAGLTASSFSVNASVNVKFFTAGATHTWTKDNYLTCANQVDKDQPVAESLCKLDFDAAFNRNVGQCKGSSPSWDQ